jgi:hypothetical protein
LDFKARALGREVDHFRAVIVAERVCESTFFLYTPFFDIQIDDLLEVLTIQFRSISHRWHTAIRKAASRKSARS